MLALALAVPVIGILDAALVERRRWASAGWSPYVWIALQLFGLLLLVCMYANTPLDIYFHSPVVGLLLGLVWSLVYFFRVRPGLRHAVDEEAGSPRNLRH